jgi:hypothetical protein
MVSVSASGWRFSRPSRWLTVRLQGLGLARAPQRAFFGSPDNVAPSVLRLVAEAGQLGLRFSEAPAFMRGVVDVYQCSSWRFARRPSRTVLASFRRCNSRRSAFINRAPALPKYLKSRAESNILVAILVVSYILRTALAVIQTACNQEAG